MSTSCTDQDISEQDKVSTVLMLRAKQGAALLLNARINTNIIYSHQRISRPSELTLFLYENMVEIAPH